MWVNEAKLPLKQYLDDLLSPICDLQVIRLYNTESELDFFPVRIFLLNNGMIPIYPGPLTTPNGPHQPNRLSAREEDKFFKTYTHWKPVNTPKPGEPGNYIRELYRCFTFNDYEEAWIYF